MANLVSCSRVSESIISVKQDPRDIVRNFQTNELSATGLIVSYLFPRRGLIRTNPLLDFLSHSGFREDSFKSQNDMGVTTLQTFDRL